MIAPRLKMRVSTRDTPAGRLRHYTIRAMPVLVLIVLLFALSARIPGLLTPRSLLSMLDSAAPLMALSAGATVVILCGGIDLSTAALASLASVLLALWTPSFGTWAVIPVVAVTTVAGLVQGMVHVLARVPSFIVTLGGMALWSGLALVFSGASSMPIKDYGAIEWGSTPILGLPSTAVVSLLLIGVIVAVLRLTPFGRWVASVGHAEPAARISGLPVSSIKVAAFTMSGASAGIAAVLIVAQTFSGGPTLADSLLLPSLAAIVIGGTAITGGHGGLGRIVIGVLIIVLLRSGLGLIGVGQGYEPIFYGILIIAAVSLTIDRSKLLVMK